MITILSLKTPSKNPYDAVDTVNHNVFSRLDEVNFIEAKSFFRKISILRKQKPDYAMGLGSVNEVFFLPFLPKNTQYIIAWHTLLRKTKAWCVRKILFKKASKVIAVSQCAGNTVKKFFPKKPVSIAVNGVDLDFFNPSKANKEYLKEKFTIDFSKPIVLFVGAMFKRKRPDVFIEIAKQYSKANFVLVGRKGDEEFLLKTKNLSNFQWIPNMNREEVAMTMATSDVFLFPSINEPCAAVIPEALASGLPAILSKSCGNSEMLVHKNGGFLVEPGEDEISEMTKYLDLILANPKNLKQAARARCVDYLNWDRTAKDYFEFLSS